MSNSCLIHFICNAKYASLFEMELEEFTYESNKITASSQANMLSKHYIKPYWMFSTTKMNFENLLG